MSILAGVIFALLVVLIIADTVGRNVFSAPVPGAVALGTTALVCIVFFALPYGQREDQHVALDLFTNLFSTRVSAILKALGLTIVLVGLGIVTYGAINLAVASFNSGETLLGIVAIPTWPARAFIAVGLFVLCMEIIRTIVLELKLARSAGRQHEVAPQADPSDEKGL